MLIAQLSDLHVRPRGQRYKGLVDANHMLAQAIAHLHQLDRQPDLVLISGDLVDEGQPAEYEMLAELLATLRLPFKVMPGNHDQRDAFVRAFPGHTYLPRSGPLHWCDASGPLAIVAIDACVPGQHHGHVDAAGLQWLQHTLAAHAQQPTLVLLHLWQPGQGLVSHVSHVGPFDGPYPFF